METNQNLLLKKIKRKVLKGTVVSDKMNKTIIVDVSRYCLHRLYKKYIRKNKKFKVHDSKEQAKIGDYVEIIQCRPISKFKSFRLKKIIKNYS